jgi:hypothetical protein
MRYVKFIGALLIVWIFGSISVLVDLDSIWKILGITSPFNFTLLEGRDFHTPLLFVLFACIFSIVATTFASRQGRIRRTMEIFLFRVYRISTPILEPIHGNYSDSINNKCITYKKVGRR